MIFIKIPYNKLINKPHAKIICICYLIYALFFLGVGIIVLIFSEKEKVLSFPFLSLAVFLILHNYNLYKMIKEDGSISVFELICQFLKFTATSTFIFLAVICVLLNSYITAFGYLIWAILEFIGEKLLRYLKSNNIM